MATGRETRATSTSLSSATSALDSDTSDSRAHVTLNQVYDLRDFDEIRILDLMDEATWDIQKRRIMRKDDPNPGVVRGLTLTNVNDKSVYLGNSVIMKQRGQLNQVRPTFNKRWAIWWMKWVEQRGVKHHQKSCQIHSPKPRAMPATCGNLLSKPDDVVIQLPQKARISLGIRGRKADIDTCQSNNRDQRKSTDIAMSRYDGQNDNSKRKPTWYDGLVYENSSRPLSRYSKYSSKRHSWHRSPPCRCDHHYALSRPLCRHDRVKSLPVNLTSCRATSSPSPRSRPSSSTSLCSSALNKPCGQLPVVIPCRWCHNSSNSLISPFKLAHKSRSCLTKREKHCPNSSPLHSTPDTSCQLNTSSHRVSCSPCTSCTSCSHGLPFNRSPESQIPHRSTRKRSNRQSPSPRRSTWLCRDFNPSLRTTSSNTSPAAAAAKSFRQTISTALSTRSPAPPPRKSASTVRSGLLNHRSPRRNHHHRHRCSTCRRYHRHKRVKRSFWIWLWKKFVPKILDILLV